MTILLTGASGFIGRHVLGRLLRQGHAVKAVVRDAKRAAFDESAGALSVLDGGITQVQADQLKGCEALVHLAAHGVVAGMNDWPACFQTNVADSLALWLRAINAGVKRFIICGSCFEYGRSGERYDFIPVDAPLEPTAAYHASKAAATMAALGLAADRNVEMLILRPFHVFGPGEAPRRFWPALRQAALSGADFPMTTGEQVRDFVRVEEVADAFCAAVVAPEVHPGHPVIRNLGSGSPMTLRAFAEAEWARMGARGRLLIGAVAQRPNETMRYVPDLRSSKLQ